MPYVVHVIIYSHDCYPVICVTTSLGLIYNVIHNFHDYGNIINPFACTAGRPSLLSNEDTVFINSLLVANPSFYLDEIQQKLSDIRGVEISIPMQRTHGWSPVGIQCVQRMSFLCGVRYSMVCFFGRDERADLTGSVHLRVTKTKNSWELTWERYIRHNF